MTRKSTAAALAAAGHKGLQSRAENIVTAIRKQTDNFFDKYNPQDPCLFDNMMMIDTLPAKDRAEFLKKCPPAQQDLIKQARQAFSSLIELHLQGLFHESLLFIHQHRQPDIRSYLNRRYFQLKQLQKILARNVVHSAKELPPSEAACTKAPEMVLGAMAVTRKNSGNKVNFISAESIYECLIVVPLCIAAARIPHSPKRRTPHKRLPPDVTKAASSPPRSRLSGRTR